MRGFIVQPCRSVSAPVMASGRVAIQSLVSALGAGLTQVVDGAGFKRNAFGDMQPAQWCVDVTGLGTLFAQAIDAAGGRVLALYRFNPSVHREEDYLGDQVEAAWEPGKEKLLAKAFSPRRKLFDKTSWRRVARALSEAYVLQTREDPRGGLGEFHHYADEVGLKIIPVVPDIFTTPQIVQDASLVASTGILPVPAPAGAISSAAALSIRDGNESPDGLRGLL